MGKVLSFPPAIDLDSVQHFVFEDASWELYESLLKDIGSRPIRVTYDEGRMEIMSPLPEHEKPRKFVGRMIEMLAFLMDIPVACFGSTMFRRKDRRKGLEPDECYYFRDEEKMRPIDRLDLRKDPPPKLVVEIDVTHRSVPREPIYAALGVPEMWRLSRRGLACLHLKDGEYVLHKLSLAFAFLEPRLLKQFIDIVPQEGERAAMKAFVAWVKKNGWARE